MSNEIVRTVIEKLGGDVSSAFKASRNVLFPYDFEYYMCALELTTFSGDVIDYFAFPIMPNSLQKVEANRTSTYRTFGGVVVLGSDSFTGGRITVQGNFGRSFRFLVRGGDIVFGRGLLFSSKKGIRKASDIKNKAKEIFPDFYPGVKSGFGCIKILQSIIDKSKGNDNGEPFKLYFHNPALSESYLVVAQKEPLTLSQEVGSSNMIWNYNLSLDIISDMSNLSSKDKGVSRVTNLLSSVIQDSVQSSAREALKIGASYAKKIIIDRRVK